MSDNKKIAIIGVGHIGKAIVSGLLKGGIKKSNLFLSNENNNNGRAVKKTEIIFICVKPGAVKEVINGIKPYLTSKKIIISVAACVSLKLLQKYTESEKQKIVRIMPNIPVAYGKGVVGYMKNRIVNEIENTDLKKIISKLGLVVDCQNDGVLDKLSLISGCGTGYAAYFMSNLEKVAENFGFGEEERKQIILATFEGAVRNMMETKISFAGLVEEVATKGGITEEVINQMEKKRFFGILKSSIDCGADKVRHLSNILEAEGKLY